jgi:hypothetical protein
LGGNNFEDDALKTSLSQAKRFHLYAIQLTTNDTLNNPGGVPQLNSDSNWYYPTTLNVNGRVFGLLQSEIKTVATDLDTISANANNAANQMGTLANYGAGNGLTLMQRVRDYTNAIASRSTADPTPTINTMTAPIVNLLNSQRDSEVANFQASSSVAFGFFNSNILDRVTEIRNRYALLIADAVAKVNLQFRELLDRSALSAIQIMSEYRNQPLMEKMETEKFRASIYSELASGRITGRQTAATVHAQGIEYGRYEKKREFANAQGIYSAKQEILNWEADMYSKYASVAGAGAGGGPSRASAALSGAISGAASGTMIGTALAPVTAGLSIPGMAGAGAIVGGVAGLLR